jgi:glycosyltransferase involved in cell wall biosynthesis
MRTAAMAHYLSRKYGLDAVLFREAGEPDPRQWLPNKLVCESHLIDLPVHRRQPVARAMRNVVRALRGCPPLTDRFRGFAGQMEPLLRNRTWRLAVIEHSWCAGYGRLLEVHAERVVLNLHNIDSVYHTRCAGTSNWPASSLHQRFSETARRLEQRLFPAFDRVLACSESDRQRARQIAPTARVEVWPNTIPANPPSAVERKCRIVFSANFEYDPNRAAVRWFAASVWPLLLARFPQLEWVLLGRNPESVQRVVTRVPRVRWTGPVEHALPELAASQVAVVPLLSGSGTRIKILEAWAAGTPVVSTSVGAEGLPREAVRIADTPEEFAAAVGALLESPTAREDLARIGVETFNTTFTWEAGWKVLEQLGL